jgi:hypothetical protein
VGQSAASKQRWKLAETGCKVKDLAGWQKGAAGYQASVRSLLKEMDEAENRGDAGMTGVDLYCLGNGVALDGNPD